MITGLHHIALSVLQLDAAIAFYTREQAFTVLQRFEIADTVDNRAMLQLDNAAARVAFLQGTLGCLELFEFESVAAQAAPEREVYSAGLRHICLQTAISDDLYDGLLAAGATAHARPAGLGTGNSYVYIRDPEGNLIELEGTPWVSASETSPSLTVAVVMPSATACALSARYRNKNTGSVNLLPVCLLVRMQIRSRVLAHGPRHQAHVHQNLAGVDRQRLM